MCANLQTVRGMMGARPDILGAHLEGPFLALSRKGAHDPECLKDPVPEYVDRLLHAANGCLRQITIAPELPHGIDAIRRFAAAGVVPAVGHCDADYATACRGFDAGAGIMTHMFNAMNGLHHREPGPIPAAVEDPRVTVELINDGFHVQDPMVRLGFGFAPHRIAFVTDAMAATDCPDGHYLLGALDVNVIDGHARLASNGAIAGSTLTLEKAVQRAVLELGFTPTDAVEAATLIPAKAFGFDRANPVTKQPLGLLASGYAATCFCSTPPPGPSNTSGATPTFFVKARLLKRNCRTGFVTGCRSLLYLEFLFLVLRGEAVAGDETGGDSHMLADFAVGGQCFGKHEYCGFRKFVLADVVRR